jgi:hypothetical protein
MTEQNQIDPAADREDRPARVPAAGRFLRAIGVDLTEATDDPPHIIVLSDRVWVTYTGLRCITHEELLTAMQAGPEWNVTDGEALR